MQEVRCESNPVHRYTHFYGVNKEFFLQMSNNTVVNEILKSFSQFVGITVQPPLDIQVILWQIIILIFFDPS
jgi:hypothetical protein